jgi:hypothetical protein
MDNGEEGGKPMMVAAGGNGRLAAKSKMFSPAAINPEKAGDPLVERLVGGDDLSGDDRSSLALRLLEAEARAEKAESQIEAATQAMVETQPDWGWRLHLLLASLGLDFGDPESLAQAIRSDVLRQVAMDHPDLELGDRFNTIRESLARHLRRCGGAVEPGPLRAAMRAAGVLPTAEPGVEP